jgi:hypothetical protein
VGEIVHGSAKAKADSSAALRNDNQKKQLQRQRQKQPQVLRLAALAQDDNIDFGLIVILKNSV